MTNQKVKLLATLRHGVIELKPAGRLRASGDHAHKIDRNNLKTHREPCELRLFSPVEAH